MGVITTRTQIPAEVSAFYDRTLLERALPLLVFTKWAQVRDIPAKAGTDTIKFRRYTNLVAATTPLTEGITPAGSSLAVTDITATVLQYGDYVTLTDVVQFETPDAIMTETAQLLGDQYADTIDQLTRDILSAGTSVRYANSRTTRITVAAGDIAALADFDAIALAFKNNKARKMTSQIDASTGYNTSPIRAAFIGICHTNNAAKIRALTGFISVEKYASQVSVMEGEFGSYGDWRFIETTNAKVFTGLGAAGIDVYSVICLAANAYGTTRISGEALKNIIKPLGSAGSADPLDQRATSGWKATFIAKILNNDFIYRYEHALT